MEMVDRRPLVARMVADTHRRIDGDQRSIV